MVQVQCFDTGHFHELSSWQKQFKNEWQWASTTSITLPLNLKYQPDTQKWVCTCPQFVKSQFLICKCLVQVTHPVSPIFFLERSESKEDEEPGGNICFFHFITTLQDFTDGLEYQIQFGNHRMLNTIEHEGASFIQLMKNCLDHEQRENSSCARSPTTWEQTTANVLFYHSCPPVPEHDT
ncbi:hypothetical protein F5J12DRAFT_905073 [Pisolithus orientalis]|uniref:uncharacterized protein n=1 Tax=Pisolithus orientalis TaxID=936130 RepID=UPI002224CEA4|nr:uncharacterized protein F5J12DRAFT_905073 [Pisolithus orientalis]KAI6009544.1 hypothetical protein F5J12DRAFT_905073 [Pisolithus orientalis]